MSDLLQFFSAVDPSPWSDAVGLVPREVKREALGANRADLLLTGDDAVAVVELKVAHVMSREQQEKYEELPSGTRLYLAGLGADAARVTATGSSRWAFLALGDLLGQWSSVDDLLVRPLAGEASNIIESWDRAVSRVFDTSLDGGPRPLAEVDRKFLARVVSRRIAFELEGRDPACSALAWVTSGGGLPLVQAWTPVRAAEFDRSFIAEVRWREGSPSGELRFGVDFAPTPGREEDEEIRRSAFDLAVSMDADIEASALVDDLASSRSDLAALLSRVGRSRPLAKGDWEDVIRRGLKGTVLSDGRPGTRRRVNPAFYGDGTLRHQAIADVNFARASARDVVDLIHESLRYLVRRQPEMPS